MTIKEALYTYLTGMTGVRNVVADRIYPMTAPTDAELPYITYEQNDGPATHHMGGVSGISNPSFQFDCYGATSIDASAVAKAMYNAIAGFRGVWGDVTIRSVFLEDESDLFEIPDDGSEEGTFTVRLRVTIWYFRQAPTFI